MNSIAEGVIGRRAHLSENRDRLVIDADVHLSDPATLPTDMARRIADDPNYFHGRPISREDALSEMAMAGVDMALVWQNPSATDRSGDPEHNFECLLAANRYIRDAAQDCPDRFIPAGWTDPKALGAAGSARLVDHLIRQFGFTIVKMNPAQNEFPITDPIVFETVERIVGQGAVPAFHIGADTPFTPPEGLEAIARRFPDSPVIAVHMGGGGAGYVEAEDHYEKIRRLGLDCPNLFFPLSAKRDTHIESDFITYQTAGEPFCLNIACASDAPYGRMTWNFGGYRLMFESLKNGATHTDPRLKARPDLISANDEARYMGGNMADLAIRAADSWLAVNG